jgi:uncharacterized protein (DUF4415 family)
MKKPLTNKAGEVRELTTSDMKEFKRFEDMPESFKKAVGQRGKQKAPVKTPTTLRFDSDILAIIKSNGRGWQTKLNQFLRSQAEQLKHL